MVYLPFDSPKREGLTIHNHIQYQNPHKLHQTLKEFMRIIKTNQFSHTLHLLPKIHSTLQSIGRKRRYTYNIRTTNSTPLTWIIGLKLGRNLMFLCSPRFCFRPLPNQPLKHPISPLTL